MSNSDYSIMCMYAVTPCHAGSGSALGVVDLPIQRERHTNWPVIQSSGMKGALRANFERYKNINLEKPQLEEFTKLTDNIFGDTSKSGSGYAGAISVSDAKILAFPMRSSAAPFVWITCPAILKRLNRDLSIAKEITVIEMRAVETAVKDGKAICVSGGFKPADKILLEDYEVEIVDPDTKIIQPLLDYIVDAERLLIVSDEIFNYGVSDCTQITAQITIDQKTGTTQDGSLRYQEELPSDTLMYSIIHWGDTKSGVESLKAETIREFVQEKVIREHIQVGGDETLGRGIFALNWK